MEFEDARPESRNQSQMDGTVVRLREGQYASSIRSIFESLRGVQGEVKIKFVINPMQCMGVQALYNGGEAGFSTGRQNTQGFFRTCMVRDVDYDGRVQYTLGHDQQSAVEEGRLNDFILTFDKGDL